MKGIVVSFSPLAHVQIIVGRATSHIWDDVVIQLIESNGICAKGKYVRFLYDNENGAAPLPEKMFYKLRAWQFELTRDVDFYTTLNKVERFDTDALKYELVRTSWAKSLDFNSAESVPCFRLEPKGFKKVS